jgi:hypothetical protein
VSHRLALTVVGAIAALATLTGCVPSEEAPDIRLPPAGAAFDYQLGGGYGPPEGVSVVARDSTDESVGAGVYDICYVNGFQTQPGEGEHWVAEHPALVLRDADGAPVVDPGWPDEYLLDTSTPTKRDEIAALLGIVVASCLTGGFEAVEIDNLDSYTRSDGRLTIENNIALAAAYARFAHSLGLAIAQKNDAGSSERLRDEVGFDFAITEECARYDECGDYTDVYGDLVFDIEYSAEFLPDACAAVGAAVLRDLDLATPDDPGYEFAGCG